MEETEYEAQAVNMLTDSIIDDQAVRYSPVGDEVTVDKETRTIIQKGETITIASGDPEIRNSQIEVAISNIAQKAACQTQLSITNSDQQSASNMHGSCGLVLNQKMISLGDGNAGIDGGFIKIKGLEKGSSSKVKLVKDRVTEKEVAYKTRSVKKFNGDEIRAWVQLADEDKAPELYHFRFIDGNVVTDGKVEFSMEHLAGKTMQQAIKYWHKGQRDPSITAKLALCVLVDLLDIFEKLNPFSHEDIHAGNIILENSMTVKIIDFEYARNMHRETRSRQDIEETIRKDLMGIIRIFCFLYSGYDFGDIFDVEDQLKNNNLSKLRKDMKHVPDVYRQELFNIMSMLYDTVRDPNQEGFGNTSSVATYIKSLLPQDVEKFKKEIAVILFEADGVDSDEVDGQSNDSVSTDSEYMADYIETVTLKD